MRSKALILGCAATMSLVWAVHAQSTRPQAAQAPPPPAAEQPRPARPAPRTPAAPAPVRASNPAPAAPTVSVDEQRAFLGQYSDGCHTGENKAAGLDTA